MHVCCGSRWGRCVLLINILDSVTAPCLLYNTTVYSTAGAASMAVAWFIQSPAQASVPAGSAKDIR